MKNNQLGYNSTDDSQTILSKQSQITRVYTV